MPGKWGMHTFYSKDPSIRHLLPDKMRVLLLVSRLNIGGTEKYILSVSKYLKSQGVYSLPLW